MMRANRGPILVRKVPQCDQYVWLVKPDPNVDGQRGRGHSCRERATHTVTFTETGTRRTEHACLAHLCDVLDRAERRREFQRYMYAIEWPAPVVSEVTIAVDTRAAAYGHHRLLRIERVIEGPIPQALIVGEPPLQVTPPRPRRDRRRRLEAQPDMHQSTQHTLF